MSVVDGGWGWPAAARVPHFFAPNEIISACRRWMYSGERFRGKDDVREGDCKSCQKEAAK